MLCAIQHAIVGLYSTMSILVSILYKAVVLYHFGSIGKSIKIIDVRTFRKWLLVASVVESQLLCRRRNGQWFESRFLSLKVKPLKEDTHESEWTIPLKELGLRIIFLG